ncbi:MAG: phosphate acyltransferase PlsX [bacterium]
MKIAIDAMGGDIGPRVTVTAAVNAAREFGLSLFIVGQEDVLTSELARHDISDLDLIIKDASQIVSMDDSPSQAIRQKKDSSIRVAAELVKSGQADGMVSAGNTGVVMATAKIFFKALEGVDRPAIATVMPTMKGACLFLDVGANVDCKPKHLLQFAVMGHAYAQQVLHFPKPRVGLLSIGSEESKGNELTRIALGLIKQVPFDFVGNVEGRDVFRGEVDVVVTDGFVGNVALKIAEGVEEMIATLIRKEIKISLLGKLGYLLMKPVFKNLKKRVDYSEYGGAPLLGLNKACIICHGMSDTKAIKNAVRIASDFITKDVNSQIFNDIAAIKRLIENKEVTLGEAL